MAKLKLGALYNKLGSRGVKKRKEENRKYFTQKANQIRANKTREINETTKRLKENHGARSAASFTKGFASGLSLVPIKEDKNETFGDYRIRQYAPEAAKQLQNAVQKARNKQNKELAKAKKANIAGNIAGTITGAVATSGATKAIAGKALGTNAAKKTTGKLAEKLTQKAIKDKTKKTLTRKLLSRMAEKSGRKVTETSLRNAAQKFTGKVAENIAQDVAYDTTFGAAKDISRYIEAGGDPRKNPADFAKYMAGNAAANTVYGAIGNVMLPGLGALRKGKSVKAIQRVRAARNAADEATDILSPKMAKPSNGAVKKLYKMTEVPDNIKYNTVRNAMNDSQYLDEVRRHGINGKSVRQLAAEQHKSVSEVVAEDYAKRRGVSMENLNALRRNAEELPEGVSATGGRIAHRPGYEPPKPEPLSAAEAGVTQQAKEASEAGKMLQPQKLAPTDTAKVAASEPSPDLDVSMGGTRTGTQAGRSEAADTAIHAKGMTEEDTAELNKLLVDTKADRKWSEGNKEALDKVAERVNNDGIEASAVSLRRKFDEGLRWTNEDTAETAFIGRKLNEEIRAAEELGDVDRVKALTKQRDEVYTLNAIEASETGKTLQAQKQFQMLTPDGRVDAALKLKARMEQKLGIKNFELDESLLDKMRNAGTEQELEQAKREIRIALWDQVPSTMTEKAGAWRYIAMLLNPKTHVRNFVGNVVFMPPRAMSNALAAVGESVLEKTGKISKENRTRSVVIPGIDSDYIKRGKESWNDGVGDLFMNGTDKWEATTRRAEGSKIFKGLLTPVQWLSDFNTWALTKEDEIFAKIAYTNAYAGYLKARGINPADAAGDVLEKAKQFAWDEAMTATYRESNIIADALNNARSGVNISWRDFKNAKNGSEMKRLLLKKVGGTAADALQPFVKTPLNIAKEGIYYSPVSFVRAAGKIAHAAAMKGGTDDIIDAIYDVAQGLTGTGMIALGYMAAKNGLVTSSIDTNTKTDEGAKGAYNKDRGYQEYAININGKEISKYDLFNGIMSKLGANDKKYSMTADSLVPAAMGFFWGAELEKNIESHDPNESEEDKLVRYANTILGLTKMTDPIMNLSMLSSLQNALNTWDSTGDSGSGKASGREVIWSAIRNTVQSRLGQYVPTVGGQIVNTFGRDAKPDTNTQYAGALGSWDRFRRNQANKIPGLTNMNPDKSDAFGQKVDEKQDHTPGTYAKSAVKNFLSPFNIRAIRETPADKAIQDLVDEGIAPSKVYPKKQYESDINKSFGDKEMKVDLKDVASYNEDHGQYALDQINKLVKTEQYKNATKEEKASLIQGVYRDAKKYATEQLAKSKGMSDREIALANLEEYWYKVDKKEEYLNKEKKLKSVGINNKASMKMWNRTETAKEKLRQYNSSSTSSPGITVKTLAAMEGAGKVLNKDQAKAATNAYDSTRQKAANLYNAGFTSEECAKLALTDAEQEKLAYYTKNGTKRGIDMNKLKLFVSKKKLSKREKWACYELNHTDKYGNPFSY